MALPLPRVIADVGPGGGIVTSMAGQNALTRSALDNMTAGAQAKYAESNAYADANLKMAQAQAAYPQSLATILSSPAATQMSNDQIRDLTTKYQNAISGMGQQSYFPNMPLPNQGGLLQRMFARPQMQPQGQIPNTNQGNTFSQPMPQTQPGNPNFGGANALGSQGGQPLMSNAPPPVNNTFGYNTPAAGQEQQTRLPGTIGPNTPQSVAQAQQEANKTTATGQAATENEMYRTARQKAATEAQFSTDLINATKQWSKNYDDATLKGPGLGNLVNPYGMIAGILNNAGLDVTPEQLMNSGQTDILTLLAPIKGADTDASRELLSGFKVQPAMTERAKQIMTDGIISSGERLGEKTDFINQMSKNNPNATELELEALWRQYNLQYPPFDKVNQKVNPQYKNKWQAFATPQALQQYRNTGTFIAPKIKEPSASTNSKLTRTYSDADWEYTAKKYNKTVEQVKKDFGVT